jgi:phenylacetic acid degradation protein paaN
MPRSLFETHRPTLERALQATRERAFWSPYPESPSRSIYGDDAREQGEAAFRGLLHKDFTLLTEGAEGWLTAEESAYGVDLGVRYQRLGPEAAIAAARAALPAWRDVGVEVRTGVCLEILHRLNARSFELAHAGMHTTGQPFVMAFQATGPHAQDRGLEAVAHGYAAMTRHQPTVVWDKQTARQHTLMGKEFFVVPRGVALVICCSTFPTWNGYPGLFASLVTGNPVVVKPHRRAVLPLAITVRVAQEVLAEQGLPTGVLTLVVDGPDDRHAATLATAPEVRIVDYTGSAAFGEWLEQNARQARVYTEKAGVNSIVIDSTDDLDGMCRNIARSLALFSGQMCTAPQAVFVPGDGVPTDRGRLGYYEVAGAISSAIKELTKDAEAASHVVGTIAAPDVVARVEETSRLGEVLCPSETLGHPDFPEAQQRTPLVMAASAEQHDLWGAERFGPISFAVRTASTQHSLELVRELSTSKGALTTAVYSTSEQVLQAAKEFAVDTGVTLSINLTGDLLVNQSAAFSDFHGTGNNPAANSALVDEAFVTGRFAIVEVRRPAASPA